MTPADLQNELIKRIGVALAHTPLKTSYNDHKSFKVFKQDIPELHSSEIEYDEDGNQIDEDNRFPSVTVKLVDGEQEENHNPLIQKVALIIGVKNESLDGKGFDDAVAAMQAIVNDLNANPMINKRYPLKYPIRWIPYEENTFPHFFVGVDLSFELLTINNVGGLWDDAK